MLLILSYIYFDPFKVLRSYNDYYDSQVVLNRDYVSTEVFIRNYKIYNYNSFIFGSSRTLAFRPNSWKKYLDSTARPFMFDASSESIYGIYTKIRFLDSLDIKMKNVLIILCRDASFAHTENHNGHLFIKDPKVSNESKIVFQNDFFKAYLNPGFLLNFYSYKITGKYKKSMASYIMEKKINQDKISNKMELFNQEIEIDKDARGYYLNRKDLFYLRGEERVDSVKRIKNQHLKMLQAIKTILVKRKVNYRIVLSPLYEQIKFNEKDLSLLKEIFKNHIYDYSGKNHFTDEMQNYYENSHYRPLVGDSILANIYKK